MPEYTLIVALIVVTFGVGPQAPAEPGGSGRVSNVQTSAQGGALKTFDLNGDADFKNYRQVITRFARAHRPNADNSFCALGFLTGDGIKSAWVVWKEGRQIVLWDGGTASLDASRRKINLKSDVVAREDDLHGSTYLVTQTWVDDITRACDRDGTTLRVGRNRK
jgi:hypothetical protein